MTSRHRMDTLFGLVAAAGLLMGASPVRTDAPITGQVTDVDTNAPIEGAVIALGQHAFCPRLGHGEDSHEKPTRETTTDAEGRFTIGGGMVAVPCLRARWVRSLGVLAPGYLADSAVGAELDPADQGAPGPRSFQLDRIRYRVELEEYERLAKYSRAEAGSKWADTLVTARSLSVQPVGRLGVFAAQPGAAFDRVAAVERGDPRRLLHWAVIAQDRTTGALYGWTTKGTREPLPAIPAGSSLLSDRRPYLAREPLFAQPGRLHFVADEATRLRGPLGDAWVPVDAQFGNAVAALEWGAWTLALEANGREVTIYDMNRWIRCSAPGRPRGEGCEILPGPRLAVDQLLPGAQGPIECMARLRAGY